MKHASLFSGIGGFDLAAQWMGWENVFQVEIDEFCQKVLAKNFPNAKRYGDIKQFDGTEWAGKIDILTGGFPCQPFSLAGQRKGKGDDRYLWPQMLRVIREIKPRWIVGENVAGIVNMALDEVLTSLEGEGYNTETYIIPACAVNAPHRRDRFWIVAHSRSDGRERHQTIAEGFKYSRRWEAFCKPYPYVPFGVTAHAENNRRERQDGRNDWTERGILQDEFNAGSEPLRRGEVTTNTNSKGIQRGQTSRHTEGEGTRSEQFFGGHNQPDDWREFPTQPPVCRRDDGIPNRVDRIKSLGNAIVPQVAFEIFKAIESVRG